jgi:hypothetical protein
VMSCGARKSGRPSSAWPRRNLIRPLRMRADKHVRVSAQCP